MMSTISKKHMAQDGKRLTNCLHSKRVPRLAGCVFIRLTLELNSRSTMLFHGSDQFRTNGYSMIDERLGNKLRISFRIDKCETKNAREKRLLYCEFPGRRIQHPYMNGLYLHI